MNDRGNLRLLQNVVLDLLLATVDEHLAQTLHAAHATADAHARAEHLAPSLLRNVQAGRDLPGTSYTQSSSDM